MFHLLCIEALTFMRLHGSWTMDCLNKANHRFIAFRIKVDIVTCAYSWEPGSSVFQRVVTDRAFDIVAEIAGESLAVWKLNTEGLIVYGRPSSTNLLTIAPAWGWAFLGGCFVPIQELYAPCFLSWELELVICCYDLDLIRDHVSADFISLE